MKKSVKKLLAYPSKLIVVLVALEAGNGGRRTEGKAGKCGLQGLQLFGDDYTIVYEDRKLM